jgi:biopolymer transport protein ExbB
VIDYIQKGGLLMWPILACSIISIAVFAERLFYFHRATIHVGEFLKGLSNLIRRRNFAEALHESAGTPGPVARVIHAAIIRHDAPRGNYATSCRKPHNSKSQSWSGFFPCLLPLLS